MNRPYQSFVVLGGGSAGFLAALALKTAYPHKPVTVIRSPNIPIIGVGESTTPAIPRFLHGTLGFDFAHFVQAVQPSIKLGIRFEWGDAQRTHFNYPFDFSCTQKNDALRHVNAFYCLEDLSDASLFSALMNQGRSPFFLQADRQLGSYKNYAYHIENKAFVAYLEAQALARGTMIIDENVVGVGRRDDGGVAHLALADGRQIAADLYVDCSGFASYLLGQTLGEPFVSFADSLFCDTAVVGSWDRREDEPPMPYTTAETMNSGWCWKIEFGGHINRGYVHSSRFCSLDEATAEFKAKNPYLSDDLRTVRFKSGRYARHWVHNVVAVGNASGFVEPLESTALQIITEAVRFLCKALLDSDANPSPRMVAHENKRMAVLWDDTRNFLSLHYRFNTRLDTPFWRHCREHVNLAGAAPIVDYYREAGPSLLASSMFPLDTIFGMEGFWCLLIGQGVPTECRVKLTDDDRRAWQRWQHEVRAKAAQALRLKEWLWLFKD